MQHDDVDVSHATALYVQDKPIEERERVLSLLAVGAIPPEVEKLMGTEAKHGDPDRTGYQLLHPGKDDLKAPMRHLANIQRAIRRATEGTPGDIRPRAVLGGWVIASRTPEPLDRDTGADIMSELAGMGYETRFDPARRIIEVRELPPDAPRPASTSDFEPDPLPERDTSFAWYQRHFDDRVRRGGDAVWQGADFDEAMHAIFDMDYTAPDGTRYAARVSDIGQRPLRGDDWRADVFGEVYARRPDDGQWFTAGKFHRRLLPASSSVSHELLELTDTWQGRGFAEAFVEHSEAEYVEAGFTKVRLEASMTGGGYAWARMGFDWDPDDPGEYLDDMLRTFADLALDPSSSYDDRTRDQVVDALRRFGFKVDRDADWEAQADRDWDPYVPGVPVEDWPTPYELAMIGWTPERGHGRDAHWLGKDVMRGSTWNGIYDLSKRPVLAKSLVRGEGEDRGDFLARVRDERRRELAAMLAEHGDLGDEAADWSRSA